MSAKEEAAVAFEQSQHQEETVIELQTNPVYFIEQVLGEIPWQKQIEIIEAVRDHKEVAVASCHGAGKSWIAARTVLWFTVSNYLSRCITTAPSFDQVKDILWQEIRQAYASSMIPLGGKLLETRLDFGAEWFATGRTSNDPNRFQGPHSPTGHIMVVADEAAGIKPDIWVAIDGITSSAESHILAIGNPTESSGDFYNMFRRPGVHKIHISAFDTPNFTAFGITLNDIRDGTWEDKIGTQELPAPYLVDPGWVAERLSKWHEDSLLWISRVLGEFPASSADALIPLSWIERAQKTRLEPGLPNHLAVDVARFGDDETVIGQRRGPVARILKVTHQEDTMITTGRIVQALQETGATEARIDADGLGAGVYDRLMELAKPAIEIRSGFASDDPEHFVNKRSEWWWGLRERFEAGDIDLDDDEDLSFQLSSIKYKPNSRGQTVIESKEDMKKRGLKSPDKADMVMMLFAAVPQKEQPLVYVIPSAPIRGPAYNPRY